ncbi:unnamed protein product [Mycena citricolor]|uniref:STEEP1 domain-containing protein n=1 Tax=Mycena citricolor TaxID=2018698 RepID=A0AAD2HGH6_9AGAR|nr:unnamed protein product [Mycena citricolor]
MPKVVSRSAVFSRSRHPQEPVPLPPLQLIYAYIRLDCICGEFILVIDKSLASLPRRPTDGAIIIRAQDNGDDEKARVFKLNAVVGDPILVERTGGHECQYRFTCPRCTLPIGYQATPPPMKSGPYVYLLSGALSQVQGQVPADAFEGDEQGESNK